MERRFEVAYPRDLFTFEQELVLAAMFPGQGKFNYQATVGIDWSKWSWNPIVGCLHGCEYCYARDIAIRFYKTGFEPTFRPERLAMPFNTKIPAKKANEPGIHNVFLGSMTDMFGDFIKVEWFEQVMDVVRRSPQWTYLILTKNPRRIPELAPFPENVWIGATVDEQKRVPATLEAFRQFDATVKFVSCEPLSSRIELGRLEALIDWLIIGGRSRSSRMPAAQPEWAWVQYLLAQAHEMDIKVYMKPNLTVRAKEYPVIGR